MKFTELEEKVRQKKEEKRLLLETIDRLNREVSELEYELRRGLAISEHKSIYWDNGEFELCSSCSFIRLTPEELASIVEWWAKNK